MGHLLSGQETALASAKELAVGERSATMERFDAEWEASPDAGDRINAELLERYAALPLAELRERFVKVAGELRGYLTVVPESRWIKHADHQAWFISETLDHYEDHAKDLQAILEAVS